MRSDPIVIVSLARTPIGAFQGTLSALTAPELAGFAIKSAVERISLDPEVIDEVILGNVLMAGVGQSPARQAIINGNLPLSVGCTTINKVCGSGMKSVMLAHDLISAGTNQVMIAGGMESMSKAPYLLPGARGGYRLGHSELIDHMFFDGLADAYYPETKGRLMGTFAEECADIYGFTREAQDKYATESSVRAKKAIEAGNFNGEIAAVTIKNRNGDMEVSVDEPPLKVNIERIPSLRPAFKKDGTVTAANSSSISDGAGVLILMRQSKAEELGIKPIAKIVSHANYAHEPRLFTTAPVGAIKKVLKLADWAIDEVDLWEINEAFAVVTMAAIHDLELSHDKVNVYGGACALGHPIGASGTRILITLINALKNTKGKRGVASLCIGGGEATAMAIEIL